MASGGLNLLCLKTQPSLLQLGFGQDVFITYPGERGSLLLRFVF